MPAPRFCQEGAPTNTPDLFQIDVNNTQATLYFAPANNADRYYISYGDGDTTGQYGVEFVTGRSTGVVGYTVNYLQPGQRYTFTIRGGNGCMPGEWSNRMTITTRRSAYGGTSYYKNFASRVLSYFPKKVDYVQSAQVLGASTEQAVDQCASRPVQVQDPLWSLAPDMLGVKPVLKLTSYLLRTTSPSLSFYNEMFCI